MNSDLNVFQFRSNSATYSFHILNKDNSKKGLHFKVLERNINAK